MKTISCRNPIEDQEFRIVGIEKIGPNEFLITTESKAFGRVTQTVTIVPDTRDGRQYEDAEDYCWTTERSV